MSGFMQWNLDVLEGFAAIRTELLTVVMRFFTLFGEELIAILFLCVLYWCVNKRLAFGIGVSFFISGVVVQGMKIIFRVPRPWNLDPAFTAIEAEKQKVLTSYSFPSGHTQTGGSIFGTVGFAVKNRALKVAFFALVVLVGISRMYLGVHTPLDVVVSWVFTILLSLVCARWLCGELDKKQLILITTGVSALAVGLFALALGLEAAGTIDHHYALDSCKQAASALGFVLGALLERLYIQFDEKTPKRWHQVVKFAAGLVGVLLIKEVMKPLFGLLPGDMLGDSLRYFLMVFWVAAVYPFLLVKLAQRKKAAP